MKSKQTVSSIIVLLAVIAIAVPPLAFAEVPELEFSGDSAPKGETMAMNLQRDVVSITDAISSIDGRVLEIGLKPIQDHMIYHAKVFSNDLITHVFIDAGNGNVLHTSEGKTLEEIQELQTKNQEKKSDKKLEQIANKIKNLERKFAIQSGDVEIDALKQQFLDKLVELKEAIANGSTELIPEIKGELVEIRQQLNELRR